MTWTTPVKNRFRELFFPLMLSFTLLDWVILLEKKQILGISFNVNLSDLGLLFSIFFYLLFFWREILEALPRSKTVLCLGGAFLAVTFIGGLIDNPYWMISFKYWVKIHVFFGFLLVLFNTTRLTRLTMYGFCGVIAFLNLTAIIEHFQLFKEWMTGFFLIFRTEAALEGSPAASSVFVNQNIFGVLSALFLVTLLAFYFQYRHLFNRAVLFLIISLSAGGIVLSTSRNAFLTTLAGLFFLALPALRRGWSLRGLTTIATVLLVLSALFVVTIKEYPYQARRVGQLLPAVNKLLKGEEIEQEDLTINYSRALEERMDVWKFGIEKAGERPILGWGNFMSPFYLQETSHLKHLHNNFLEIFFGNGILGLSLLLGLIVLWITRLRSAWYWAPVAATLFMSFFETFIMIETWVLFTAWLVAATTTLTVPEQKICLEPAEMVGKERNVT